MATRALAVALGVTVCGMAASPADAITGGGASALGNYEFVAQLVQGDATVCTGALINAKWIITSESCFPGQGSAPEVATTAVLGRGEQVAVAGLVRLAERKLVLASLARPVLDVIPVALSKSAPQAGAKVLVAGYGTTDSGASPAGAPHVASGVVAEVTDTTFGIGGSLVACQGDVGAPAVTRNLVGALALVGVGQTAAESGCAEPAGHQTVAETRLDDLGGWITEQVRDPRWVVSRSTGLCLGIARGNASKVGDPVIQTQCRYDDASQKWAFRVISTPTSSFLDTALTNGLGFCLDIHGADPAPKAPIVQSRCDGTINQQWDYRSLNDASPPQGLIVSHVPANVTGGERCVSISDPRIDTVVENDTCAHTDAMTWDMRLPVVHTHPCDPVACLPKARVRS